MDLPTVFDAFMSDEKFAAASEDLGSIRFGFGAISTNPNLPIWRGEVDRQSLAVQLALNAVCELTGAEFELVSCHINLQTHGLDGAFHTDNGDPNGQVTHALNWYVHPYEWPVECGGYLLVGDDARNLRAILPTRNSAVLLPAHILHCATSPFLRAGAMARISLTLKLRLKNAV
jgi:Rps23 Pro-64 3,4-dihydroxylase Tpa1-like proline 4-hydroxylase